MRKILLSAYACEPNKGSEPGVGWHWAMELSQRDFVVHVITRLNNAPVINHYFETSQQPTNLTFHYVDLPKWLSWWKKRGRGIRTYYFLWQIFALFFAKNLHKQQKFSLVHHVSFVSIRQPSFMGLLGIPFIFGPVGGGDRWPLNCLKGTGFKNICYEISRELLNFLVKFDPFMLLTFETASIIYVTSAQTKQLIPKRFKSKSYIEFGIFSSASFCRAGTKHESDLLYVGRFVPLKGLINFLEAMKEVKKFKPTVSLTLIGEGPLETTMRSFVQEYDLGENITFVPWLKQSILNDYYKRHKLFVLPSFRDSGGMVIFEAMSYQLPIICLDSGGPARILQQGGGITIPVTNNHQIIADLAATIIENLADERRLVSYQRECSKVLQHFSFQERFKSFRIYHS